MNSTLTPLLAMSMTLNTILVGQTEAREIKDFTATEVRLVEHPSRIITLAPSLGELAADLLGDHLERIIGVSEFSDDPPALRRVETVGAYQRFNLEKVLSLKPDLVFATLDGNSKDQIQYLREKKIPVVVLSTESFAQIENSILLMAEALGEQELGRGLLKRFQTGLEHFKKRSLGRPPLSVFVQLNDEPIITSGKKSFLTEALQVVGAQSIYQEAESTYPRPSVEDVIQKDPDFILILAFTPDLRPFEGARKKWMSFVKMKAVKGDHVVILKSDELLRPTLRILEGLSRLENTLYPKPRNQGR